MAHANDERAEAAGGLRRVLGPVDATCVVIGAIIGVGIFFTPGRVALLAGSGGLALAAWAIGGAIALLGALTFAELGGLYPRTGGQYTILRDSYGPMPAFLFVFCNATAIQTGAIAIIAYICAQNLALAVGHEMPGAPLLLGLSVVLILGLTTANIIGVRWGSGIQNATVFAKVLTLLAVTGLAVFTVSAVTPTAEAATLATTEPDAAGGLGTVGLIFAALVPALFSFGGWQHALWIAGEVREPRRNVPRAIVGGVVVVVAVYLLTNWAYLDLLGYRGVTESGAIAADAVAAAWPGAGRRVIAGAVAVSAFGVLNAQLLSGPRLVHGMAADGRFFAPFARVSPRFGTPAPAIVLLGVLAIVLLLAAGTAVVDTLLTGVVFIDAVFFALTGFAVIVLRRRRPDAERPVRCPGYPLVPLAFVAGELAVLAGAYVDPAVRRAAFIGLAWIAVAGVCYAVFFRQHRPG